MPDSFPVLDTHTGGEITRVLFASDIGLVGHSAEQQLEQLRGPFDWIRKTLTGEPRGTEYAVGAVVTPPGEDAACPGCIVFFNNVGYLGMCGHGLIGVIEALRYRDWMGPGTYRFATPAGSVQATLEQNRCVRFTGVASRCYRQDVVLTCQDGNRVVGDIAYGGNWFFLTHDEAVHSATISELMDRSQRIRDALDQHGVCGEDGAVIDHVELCCPLSTVAEDPRAAEDVGCRNFVLCPGGHYDRSPCGTGTSAKLACLAARGLLEPGVEWIQESITGSRFVASYEKEPDGVHVTIRGRAHVIAETRQVFDPDDALRLGIGGRDR
ncbi:proline racemase family protein [Stieleria sp. ICT_E10.1]|uniref:proline racemase family protein n=1 Tax=Stieleria sedimenti TaxID=2976331 RepID=UPI00217F8F7E|nr:proline racemase family protein [Stieleria sedimenti]MCS7470141.1 proline racemase family protein [Stieleria sedimenti]